MSNQEILLQKNTFDTHVIRVEEFIMEIDNIPRGNKEEALAWLNAHSIEYREIADEIYTSEDPEDARIREEILSNDENKFKDAAKEMWKVFNKVHA